MSDAAPQQPPASRTLGEVLDKIAEDQRRAGLEPLSEDEAMELALQAQREAREERRRRRTS